MDNIEEIYSKMHIFHLEIMCEIKRLCDENNIDYFLIGGTLLGAVRHSGFIPWDDDADIAIYRKDYNKFIKICNSQLNSKFRLDICYKDEKNFIPFIKIKYKGIEFVEESNRNLDINHELFVDIFPLDKVSNNIDDQKKQKKNMEIYKFLIYGKYSVPSQTKVKGFIKQVISKIYPYGKQKLKEKYIQESSKFNEMECNYYRVFGSTYEYYKEFIPINDLKNKVLVNFEGIQFTTFSNYERYLERVYGDYIKLPSENKRYGYKHATLNINLPKYNMEKE